MRCEGKHRYTSVHAARRAHGKAGFRLRVYPCDLCRGFHVTNDEKRDGDYVSRSEKHVGKRRRLSGSDLRALRRKEG